MNCTQNEALIHALVDDELDPLRRHSIARHVQRCRDCEAKHQDLRALRARLRADVPYFAAPVALQARVRAMADAVRASTPAPAPRRVSERLRWLTSGVLAGCAASVFAWFLGTSILVSRASDDFAVAAVTTHVHAALDNRLIEVASSDRHTVKPWLSARLDYSPPVVDLADQGFPLIGGRLEHLEGRTVATLVYGYGRHTIDVYVRPDPARHAATALRTVRGFNVAHASGRTMDWVAVSDAEPAAVQQLVLRLAREEVGP